MSFKAVCLLVVLIGAATVRGYKEELKRTIAGCQNGKEVTDAELEEFEKPVILKTEEEKCLAACVFKAFNVISNNSFDKKIALAVAKDMLKEYPDKLQKITSVVNHCGDDIPKSMPNECDLAGEIMACYVKWEKEVGMI